MKRSMARSCNEGSTPYPMVRCGSMRNYHIQLERKSWFSMGSTTFPRKSVPERDKGLPCEVRLLTVVLVRERRKWCLRWAYGEVCCEKIKRILCWSNVHKGYQISATDVWAGSGEIVSPVSEDPSLDIHLICAIKFSLWIGLFAILRLLGSLGNVSRKFRSYSGKRPAQRTDLK